MRNYFITITLFLVQSVALYSVGAGLCLYRATDEGIEFLLVKDPYQRSSWRQGFEFPGGTIGDFGHRRIDQLDGKKINKLSFDEKKKIPVESYLRGAIRECLEELVYVPAELLTKDNCYKNGAIDTRAAAESIDAVAQKIKEQGQIFVRALDGSSNYTIFFWDITNLSTKDLLQRIQNKRKELLSGWLCRVSSIGAEPDQFAWVKSKELERVIGEAQHEKNLDNVTGTYVVQARQLVVQDKHLQSGVTIQLSPAFVKFIAKNSQGANQEKSMLKIIKLLEKKVCKVHLF